MNFRGESVILRLLKGIHEIPLNKTVLHKIIVTEKPHSSTIYLSSALFLTLSPRNVSPNSSISQKIS